jgi:hypothetical protein
MASDVINPSVSISAGKDVKIVPANHGSSILSERLGHFAITRVPGTH